MVGRTLGHYEIIEPLGAGGMGEAYRAPATRVQFAMLVRRRAGAR